MKSSMDVKGSSWKHRCQKITFILVSTLSTIGAITIYTIEVLPSISTRRSCYQCSTWQLWYKNSWHNIKIEKRYFLTCFISTLLSKILIIKHIRHFETTLDPNYGHRNTENVLKNLFWNLFISEKSYRFEIIIYSSSYTHSNFGVNYPFEVKYAPFRSI